ncbi:unnamed protein product [Closterium sp. NIES-54]
MLAPPHTPISPFLPPHPPHPFPPPSPGHGLCTHGSKLEEFKELNIAYGQSSQVCIAMPRHATPCHAMPRHAMPRHATPSHATPCHAIALTVDAVGTLVAWEFNLTYGKDIGFNVEYTAEDGTKTVGAPSPILTFLPTLLQGMVPYQKVDKHEGSFNAPAVGSYTITWDNTYSLLTKKTVRYKVGAIPPVETEEELKAEEALSHPEKQGDASTPTAAADGDAGAADATPASEADTATT